MAGAWMYSLLEVEHELNRAPGTVDILRLVCYPSQDQPESKRYRFSGAGSAATVKQQW